MDGAKVGRKPRDPRLDFFRGVGMAIILVAHIPWNTWTLWIPARFGFSDATEIFVFCSGFASALAFGSTFTDRGWQMGTARIAHRVWQVYWAHIGVFLVTVAMLWSIDAHGWGARAQAYITEPYVQPFFDHAGLALTSLLRLVYVPGLFDILPMYLVILALTPGVMALHRAGGTVAVAAGVVALWLAASLSGLAWMAPAWGAGGMLREALAAVGANFSALNLPASPWDARATWFFNPFAWQLVFFTGFALGMGWLPAPPVSRRLFVLALAVVIASVPLAWHRVHDGLYLPDGSLLAAALLETRLWLEPLWWKSWQGPMRFVHFLAVAYLAWVAVGPGGLRLMRPLPFPEAVPQRMRWLIGAGVVLTLTAPYAWVASVASVAPLTAEAMVASLPFMDRVGIGWASLLHFAAVVTVLRHGLPDSALHWLTGPAWLGFVKMARQVGAQSLAVFMTSIPLSQLIGLFLDHIGRGMAQFAVANIGGVALLVSVAYIVGWFKSQPWRGANARPTMNGDRRNHAPQPAE